MTKGNSDLDNKLGVACADSAEKILRKIRTEKSNLNYHSFFSTKSDNISKFFEYTEEEEVYFTIKTLTTFLCFFFYQKSKNDAYYQNHNNYDLKQFFSHISIEKGEEKDRVFFHKFLTDLELVKEHLTSIYNKFSFEINEEYQFSIIEDEGDSEPEIEDITEEKDYSLVNKIEGVEIINHFFYNRIKTEFSFSKTEFYLSKLNEEYQWYGVINYYDFIRSEVSQIKSITISSFKDRINSKVIAIVNGAGGTGKSTLLRRVALELRNEDFTILWVKEHQFDDFVNEGWSVIKENTGENYLIIIEDWYRLTNTLEIESQRFLNQTKNANNVRVLIGDRGDKGYYRRHLNDSNTIFTLKNTDNWDIINALILKNQEWNIAIGDVALYKESINNTPLFLMVYILIRSCEGKETINNFNFSNPELAFQEIIKSDIKRLLEKYQGLGKALFYWATIYEKDKFYISYSTFLEMVDYFHNNEKIGFLFKNLKNDASPYHDILRSYITTKMSLGVEYIRFNHDLFADLGISKIDYLLSGQVEYNDISKRKLLEAIFDFKSHDKSVALLLFHFLKCEGHLFNGDLERLSYIERLIESGNKELSFLDNMRDLDIDESRQLDFVKKLLFQDIYPQVFIQRQIKKHLVICSYILKNITLFKRLPSNVYFTATKKSSVFKETQYAVHAILESDPILEYNERVLADTIKTSNNSKIKQKGIRKILSEKENYLDLDKILLQRIIKYSNNYDDIKDVISAILNTPDITSLPFEIVAEAFKKSKEDTDKLIASKTIINHPNITKLYYKMVSRAMLDCPDQKLKLETAKRIIENGNDFYLSLTFHSLGCFVDEKPIPQFIVDFIEQIIRDFKNPNGPKSKWYYYKRISRIPFHSIPLWKKSTRWILNNWQKQRDRNFIHNVLLSYKEFPTETKNACREILLNWREEIEIPIIQVRREEPDHYGDHIKVALEHPHLKELAKKTALEIRKSHNNRSCRNVKLHLQKTISKIIGSESNPLKTSGNTLTEQDFPLRMNIHFCINEDLKKEIIALNQSLVDLGSEIDFSRDHIPHITILMGTIASLSNYQDIVKSITKVTSRINKQEITILNPYVLTPLNKFIFMDILPKKKLRTLKDTFNDSVKDLIKLDYYGRPESHIHLTLGFIETMTNDIEDLIQKMSLINNLSIVSKIGISAVSDKGTCLQETFTIDIKKKE